VLLLPDTGTLFYVTSRIIVTQTLSIQQGGQYTPLFQFAVSQGLHISVQFYAVNFGCLCTVCIKYAPYI